MHAQKWEIHIHFGFVIVRVSVCLLTKLQKPTETKDKLKWLNIDQKKPKYLSQPSVLLGTLFQKSNKVGIDGNRSENERKKTEKNQTFIALTLMPFFFSVGRQK